MPNPDESGMEKCRGEMGMEGRKKAGFLFVAGFGRARAKRRIPSVSTGDYTCLMYEACMYRSARIYSTTIHVRYIRKL